MYECTTVNNIQLSKIENNQAVYICSHQQHTNRTQMGESRILKDSGIVVSSVIDGRPLSTAAH